MKVLAENQLDEKVVAPPRTTVAVAKGDGIGPEIMAATLDVLQAAGAIRDKR